MVIEAISPYLRYDDADAALDWMERVLGFTGTIRWRDEDGHTYEADIKAGTTTIGVSNSSPVDNGQHALLIVHVADVDAHYTRIRAATDVEVEPPVDQPYGPRTFTVVDPWGYRWSFWQGEAIPPEPTG